MQVNTPTLAPGNMHQPLGRTATMTYYVSTILKIPFEQAVSEAIAALARRGFGILADIDVQATLKKKLGADIRKYRILGACNPPFAFKALQTENKIGTMLPCNVVVREDDEGNIEVAAVDPVASMQAIENPRLVEVAAQVRVLLEEVIGDLSSATHPAADRTPGSSADRLGQQAGTEEGQRPR